MNIYWIVPVNFPALAATFILLIAGVVALRLSAENKKPVDGLLISGGYLLAAIGVYLFVGFNGQLSHPDVQKVLWIGSVAFGMISLAFLVASLVQIIRNRTSGPTGGGPSGIRQFFVWISDKLRVIVRHIMPITFVAGLVIALGGSFTALAFGKTLLSMGALCFGMILWLSVLLDSKKIAGVSVGGTALFMGIAGFLSNYRGDWRGPDYISAGIFAGLAVFGLALLGYLLFRFVQTNNTGSGGNWQRLVARIKAIRLPGLHVLSSRQLDQTAHIV